MRCAVCSIQIHAVYVLQFAAERIAVSSNAVVRAAVQGSVRLSSGAAVCGRPTVCIFLNKFKTYWYKSAQIQKKSNNLK
jgi:hypothetical protein